ncbi:MAG: D-Ala-D-Ala carboxypeptidase family metallohydrolase [Beijerinckiaceae bacterium]
MARGSLLVRLTVLFLGVAGVMAGVLQAQPLPPRRPPALGTPPQQAEEEADEAEKPASAPDQKPKQAQPIRPTPVNVPLPPVRPFDLDPSEWLPDSLRNPPKNNPAAAAQRQAAIRDSSEEEQEWPRRSRGAPPAEPLFNPNEKPEKPGLSTDPGTSVNCVPEQLMRVLQTVILRYGHVRVTSTWRPAWRARRRSYHRRCEAVDFRVPGVPPQTVMAFIRDNPDVGGRKVYWNGLLHIDTGPVRSW